MIRTMRALILGLISVLVLGCAVANSPASPAGTAIPPSAPAATGVPAPNPTTSPPAPTAMPTTVTASGVISSAVITPHTPGPPPKPTPRAPLPRLQLVGLRYRLVDEVGRPLFCDPDYYPVARADETELAVARYPEIRADTVTYAAITAHLQIDGSREPSAAQKLAIYRDWKMLNALALTASGGGYSFDYIAANVSDATSGWHVTGTVDWSGAVTVENRAASGPPICPICLARGTQIDTPSGSRAVEDLRIGMTVWTSDGTGGRLAVPILATGSAVAPPEHRLVHLVLADGRVLDVSPGHPLADGRFVGDVHAGDLVDGAQVLSADRVPYAGGATFDLLPGGPTGSYWANGVLLGSTLRAP